MDFELMPPRDQLVMIMERIYGYGMTTTSGGNLSIYDENGDIWITPASVDKGTLTPKDIVCVRKDGTIEGIHKPSSEYPFHLAIYKKRPDIRAILHAHPAALVSYSIVKKIPDTRVIPSAQHICGDVGYAPYAIPGSEKLGSIIAETFEKGHNIVLLENHGIVTSDENLFQAFHRFETLDFCARLMIKGSALGGVRVLTGAQLDLMKHKRHILPEFTPAHHSSSEKELRKRMCEFIVRAYDQQLVTSTEGTFSARLSENAFLITPYGVDRKYITPSDIVLIENGKREAGKTPSRSVSLHAKIYETHPKVGAVTIAHPPNTMAFGISEAEFDTRTIPESYIVLKTIPFLPYGTQFMDIDRVATLLSPETPVVMVENDCLITIGNDLLHAFDKLEVAEFSAKAVIAARSIGTLAPITDEQVEELEKAFLA